MPRSHCCWRTSLDLGLCRVRTTRIIHQQHCGYFSKLRSGWQVASFLATVLSQRICLQNQSIVELLRALLCNATFTLLFAYYLQPVFVNSSVDTLANYDQVNSEQALFTNSKHCGSIEGLCNAAFTRLLANNLWTTRVLLTNCFPTAVWTH